MLDMSSGTVEATLRGVEQQAVPGTSTDSVYGCTAFNPSGGNALLDLSEPDVPVVNAVGPDGSCVSRELAELLMCLVNGRLR